MLISALTHGVFAPSGPLVYPLTQAEMCWRKYLQCQLQTYPLTPKKSYPMFPMFQLGAQAKFQNFKMQNVANSGHYIPPVMPKGSARTRGAVRQAGRQTG